MQSVYSSTIAVVIACASGGAALGNIFIGSSVNFNNGDAGAWTNGIVADPAIMPGGPAGDSDMYLRVTSDGASQGGKLTIFNNSENWTGMWRAAGITQVEMDLRNFDPQGRTLSMRMGFLTSAGQGQPGWCTQAFLLPADGQWHHAVFLISPEAMVSVGSPWDWQTAMDWVTQVRIFHSVNPSPVGVNIASSVGIDNIIALPAPGSATLLALCGLAATRRRR